MLCLCAKILWYNLVVLPPAKRMDGYQQNSLSSIKTPKKPFALSSLLMLEHQQCCKLSFTCSALCQFCHCKVQSSLHQFHGFQTHTFVVVRRFSVANMCSLWSVLSCMQVFLSLNLVLLLNQDGGSNSKNLTKPLWFKLDFHDRKIYTTMIIPNAEAFRTDLLKDWSLANWFTLRGKLFASNWIFQTKSHAKLFSYSNLAFDCFIL